MLKKGFTLIELLVAMAILAILSTIGFANFQSTRLKARDATRKSDLSQITKSLEAYNNDHRTYPASTGGKIVCKDDGATCDWGSPFTDDNGTLYAAALPQDPAGYTYYYQYQPDADDRPGYNLYAKLENANDISNPVDYTGTVCAGTETPCNYKVSSTNLP